MTDSQIDFVQNTNVARYCPCLGTTVELTSSIETTVCGSIDTFGMNVYRQYCQETFESVNDEGLYEDVLYDVAHYEYLQTVRELEAHETLSYEEILLETDAALQELNAALLAEDSDLCIEGCAIFVRDACCLDFADV